ncbi:MAG: AAA family ATPase, partial [Gemmatimonadetes bacterium]|nr:AAA family ATPase [Gemmatimonadota bacterium]
MNSIPAQPTTPARIEYLKVQNFRALRSVEFRNLTPLTVLLGPNGSGKSTVFDVFAFLAECFELGLRRAWDKRGRSKELVSREAEGRPVVIEIKNKKKPKKNPLPPPLALPQHNQRHTHAMEGVRTRDG